jgi:hypothetical protein
MRWWDVKEIAKRDFVGARFTVKYSAAADLAFLLIHRDRIVGLALVSRWQQNVWKWKSSNYQNEEPEDVRPPEGWVVAFVWIHRDYARQRKATELVHIAAEHVGADVASLVWAKPFTAPGLAFVKSMCPEWFYST